MYTCKNVKEGTLLRGMGRWLCAQPPNALFTQPTTSDGILIIIRKHTHTQRGRGSGGGRVRERWAHGHTWNDTLRVIKNSAATATLSSARRRFPYDFYVCVYVYECPAFLCVHVCVSVCAFCLRKLNLKYASDLLFTFFTVARTSCPVAQTHTHIHSRHASVHACVYGWLCLFV